MTSFDSKEVSRADASARTPTLVDAAGEIPAELVGAKGKETIERLASALGTTPVNLLRAALDIGLSGGRPITTEMLDMIDKLVEEGAEEDEEGPPSKPEPEDQN